LIEAGNLVTSAHVRAMYLSGEQNTEILKILISHAAIKHDIKEDKMWRDIVRQVLENENGFYEDENLRFLMKNSSFIARSSIVDYVLESS
jgi:hypothetical protein